MLKNFKQFIMRGNVLDLAVAVVIGGVFGKIVSSFVSDILMPPIGLLLGDVDFNNLFVDLAGGDYATLAEAQEAGAATLNYGLFINTVINFLIVAMAIFIVVRAVERMKSKPAPVAPTEKTCAFCQMAIALRATRCPHCTSPQEA
jgi:large conductance mechanosensitive channel